MVVRLDGRTLTVEGLIAVASGRADTEADDRPLGADLEQAAELLPALADIVGDEL
jgi:hypothetical protein